MNVSRKIVVVGPFSVGKTSLVRRQIEDRFEAEYRATLGVACFTKTVPLAGGAVMKQIIWDVEGGQAKGPVFKSYLRGAAAALLVADLSRPETFEELADYWGDLQATCPGVPMAVALNKADLVGPADQAAAVEQIGRRFGELVQPTSAATGQAVEDLFLALGQRTL